MPVAGLFFLTNLAAPILGFVVGRWSDRLADRLSLFRSVRGGPGRVGRDGLHHRGMDGVRAQLTVLGSPGRRATDLRRSSTN